MLETPTYFGEWRSGRTRKEKRAAKRAKYLGVPLQSGEEGVPELFFYGQDSGVVGMKVLDLEQTAQVSRDALSSGYDKVCTEIVSPAPDAMNASALEFSLHLAKTWIS